MILVAALVFCVYSKNSIADIDLPWSTTYDCPEWSQSDGQPDCDGLQKGGDWTCNGIGEEQIDLDSNHPGGGGGKGQRHWEGDGKDVNSGGTRVTFKNSENELWIRWYMSYDRGFRWSSLNYDKFLYIHTSGKHESAIVEWKGSDRFVINAQAGDGRNHGCVDGCGWYSIQGGGSHISDGSWHCYEVHLKMDTNGIDGIAEGWIDGVQRFSIVNVDWGTMTGWTWMLIGSNQCAPNNGKDMSVHFDDIKICNTGYIGPIHDGRNAAGTILFEEGFEDTGFTSRGWYDNTNIKLSSDEHISDSTSSAKFHFPQGNNVPASGNAIRRKFRETDEVYVSYFVKYSANWEGSNKPYHPHECYLLTNVDEDWTGPSSTHLTAYIEQNEGVPLLSIQDAQNIDESNIGVDLAHVTENRAVAGCNGDGDCYQAGAVHNNGKQWKADNIHFQDEPGQYFKNDWHFVEAYFKLNSISGGIGLADGQLKYWYDGNLIIDHNDVIMRTAQHLEMKFNQFLIGPYIGDGSPVDQTFWIDNLTVATSRGQGEILSGEEGSQVTVKTPTQIPELVWLPQEIDLNKHSKGPFTIKARVDGIDEERYPSIILRIKYYIGTGNSYGYFDMVKEGDGVWRFDILDPNWHRYRSKSLRYHIMVFDDEDNVITESNWQKELIDSFVQDYN